MAGHSLSGREQWGDLSPLSSSGSSGSHGDFSVMAFPCQIPHPCPEWGVNQKLLRESQGRALCTFCTAITKGNNHQVLSTGKDWTHSKTNLSSLGMSGPLQSLMSASLLSLLGGIFFHRCGSSALSVTEWSRKGPGLEVREPSWGSRATTDSPPGSAFFLLTTVTSLH